MDIESINMYSYYTYIYECRKKMREIEKEKCENKSENRD